MARSVKLARDTVVRISGFDSAVGHAQTGWIKNGILTVRRSRSRLTNFDRLLNEAKAAARRPVGRPASDGERFGRHCLTVILRANRALLIPSGQFRFSPLPSNPPRGTRNRQTIPHQLLREIVSARIVTKRVPHGELRGSPRTPNSPRVTRNRRESRPPGVSRFPPFAARVCGKSTSRAGISVSKSFFRSPRGTRGVPAW
jgi:hypothetical protein